MDMHSDELAELGAALAAAQGAMEGAKKDNENTHLKSKYADLASCLNAARDPLAANGLSVTQLIVPGEPTLLVTMLLHSSGQFIRSALVLETEDHKGLTSMQTLGLAISYLRRYAFQAIIGQASEDDDGASQKKPEPPPPPVMTKETQDKYLQALEGIQAEYGAEDYAAALKANSYTLQQTIEETNPQTAHGIVKKLRNTLADMVAERDAAAIDGA
jgi:hypothetical protein